MSDFTLEELERYADWIESLKKTSSVDPSLESQRADIALAEELARGERAAKAPLSTLGESFKKIDELKSQLPLTPSSPARESAKVFEEAGGAMPKSIAQSMVDAQSKPGKSAEEAAEILAPKELPAVREERQLVKSSGTSLEDVQTPKSKAPEVLSKDNAALIKASDATNDVIDVTPKSSSPLLSRLSKLVRLGGAGLGAAAAASDLSEGDVSNALIDLAQGAGIFAGGAATVPLEIFRTSDLNPNEDEALAEMRLKARQETLAKTGSSGIGDLRLAEANAIKRDSEPPKLGMGDLRVSDQPALEAQLKKLEELEKSKKPQPSSAARSASMRTETSPESTLMRAIESESLKKPESEIDYMAELEQAKKQRNAIQLLAMLGKAGETISTGITGVVPGGIVTKPASGDFYANLAKMAETPVEDFGTKYSLAGKEEERKRQAARRDPASSESRFARELLKSQGISVPDEATAEVLEKYSPQLTNILNQREAAKRRQEDRLELERLRQQEKTGKAEEESQRDWRKFEQSARKELNTGEIGKLGSFARKAKMGTKIIEDAIKNPSGYKDFASTYALLKATQGDTSVIREAELKLGLSLGSLPEKFRARVVGFFTGEMTDPAQRKKMLEALKVLASRAEEEYMDAANPILEQVRQEAERTGIKFDRNKYLSSSWGATEQTQEKKVDFDSAPSADELK